MNHSLLDILSCPSCKSELSFNATRQLLICRADRLAFEIRDGKPIMLIGEALSLSSEEMSKLLVD